MQVSQEQRNLNKSLSKSRKDINLEIRNMEKCVEVGSEVLNVHTSCQSLLQCAMNFPLCNSYSRRNFKRYGIPEQVIQISDMTWCYSQNRKRKYDLSTPGNETNVKCNVVISDGTKWRYDLEMTEANSASGSHIRDTAYSNASY